MITDICPLCSRGYFTRCKCPRADMVCPNDHKWHTCLIHNTVVIGPADHSLPLERCSCRIGDTESGSTIVKLPPKEVSSKPSLLGRTYHDQGSGI